MIVLSKPVFHSLLEHEGWSVIKSDPVSFTMDGKKLRSREKADLPGGHGASGWQLSVRTLSTLWSGFVPRIPLAPAH